MILLNLGCGNRFHPDWTNIDFVATVPGVQAHDLTKGILMPTESCDVVYHSHVLEHFSKADGAAFISECYRVLKPGGIIRVAVPNLEQLAVEYLAALQAAKQHPGSAIATANYEWSVIELIDQMVRTKSGGEMAAYWSKPQLENEEKIIQRTGDEFVQWRSRFLSDATMQTPATKVAQPGWSSRLKKWILQKWQVQENRVAAGMFEDAGEKHKWMYDEVSLRILLQLQGFEQVKRTDAFTSSIPNWTGYQMLDVEDHKVRKPDSIFMEAQKPMSSQ